MKKSRDEEGEVPSLIKQVESDMAIEDLCRKGGLSWVFRSIVTADSGRS